MSVMMETVLQYTALFFTLMFVGAHRLHCTNCDVLVLQETIWRLVFIKVTINDKWCLFKKEKIMIKIWQIYH